MFLDPRKATNVRKISDHFTSLLASEMRGSLYREFGKRFDVSGTGHYLVVHPVGQRDVWANRFEDLYRSFVHYFRSRGISINQPQFPMVAVVFHNKTDFFRYATKNGMTNKNYLGYYTPISNRVLLYDIMGGKKGGNWYENAETIIHEATHQTAYNTGLHVRLGETPRWVVEGLATMFEARGVWNSHQFNNRPNRINRRRFQSFKHHLNGRTTSRLAQLIAGDRLFETDQSAAYAEAWALTFFLAELEPHRYFRFLKKMYSRKPLSTYTSAQRQKDFTDVFGKDFVMLDTRLQRFMKTLKYCSTDLN